MKKAFTALALMLAITVGNTATAAETGSWITRSGVAHQTVEVGFKNSAGEFQTRASGVMLSKVGEVLTNAHVCQHVEEIDNPKVRTFQGAVSPILKVEYEGNNPDLCIMKVAKFLGIRTQWRTVVFGSGNVPYGTSVFSIGHYMLPYRIVDGYVGRYMTSPLNHQVMQTGHLHQGPGASGSGIFNKDGVLVGILTQARMKRVGPFSAIPMGAIFFQPIDIVNEWLNGRKN